MFVKKAFPGPDPVPRFGRVLHQDKIDVMVFHAKSEKVPEDRGHIPVKIGFLFDLKNIDRINPFFITCAQDGKA